MRILRMPLWARYVAAGGITLGGCGQADLEEPDDTPVSEQGVHARIEQDLDRLAALEVFEVAELINGQAEASGSPYVDGPLEIQSARLSSLATIAEEVASGIDSRLIADQFQSADGQPNLCVRNDDEHFCLTVALHQDNLARLNALEIVKVEDIIRSDAPATGFCYSSWDTVSEDDCVRALKLEAIAAVAGDEMQ